MKIERETKGQAEAGLERALSAKGKLEHFLEGVLKVEGSSNDDCGGDDDGLHFFVEMVVLVLVKMLTLDHFSGKRFEGRVEGL